jgi:F-type H+-transporting ATPase subunit alpha
MTKLQPDPGLDALAARIASAQLGPEAEELGTVAEIADGVARITGLPGAALGEVLIFPDGQRGFALALEPDAVEAAFFDPMDGVEAGDTVRRTGEIARVPVGEALLGRVIDPLGRPLDGLGPVRAAAWQDVERPAPSIIERDFVAQPLQTGLLVVDALFAIGRGQRELIIGERATGKTAIALDAMLNQKPGDVACVYVAIGERMTAVERVIDAMRAGGALENCVFVVAPASAPPGMRWLAPFAGTTIGEWFRDRGGDALIVYDDLTKHAATHRELALLARQPPGREAYPGDVFYLHARLLERSAKLAQAQGGGSLTALPIAEIEGGDLSGYIPTNLISISDGQIVLSSTLFAANQRPAVDVGLSVSRVGGKAQLGALKAVAGRVRLDYAQYLELRMFARFGGFGDAQTRARIARGERIGALLAQPRFAPLRTLDQVALLAALADGALDSLAPGSIEALRCALPAVIDAEPGLDTAAASLDTLDEACRTAFVACVRKAIESLPAGPGG